MPELSPQAQEVFWAFNQAVSGKPDDWHYLPAIAAALRAAADQVVPEDALPVGDEHDAARADQWFRIRCQLLAIATELEAFAQ